MKLKEESDCVHFFTTYWFRPLVTATDLHISLLNLRRLGRIRLPQIPPELDTTGLWEPAMGGKDRSSAPRARCIIWSWNEKSRNPQDMRDYYQHSKATLCPTTSILCGEILLELMIKHTLVEWPKPQCTLHILNESEEICLTFRSIFCD